MSASRGVFGPITALAAGERSFTVFCFGTRDDVPEVLKPGYFQTYSNIVYDGDFLVTNHVPAKTYENPYPRGRKVVSMIHKDHRSQVSLTRLFELPHEPKALQDVLTNGLLSLADPRYIPSRLEVEEQRQAEREAAAELEAAEREAAEAADPEPERPETPAKPRDRLHLKRV